MALQNDSPHESIRDLVRKVIGEVVPNGTAQIAETSPLEGAYRLAVKPFNTLSAAIVIETERDHDWIFLTAGHSPLELPPGGRQYTDAPQREEFKRICTAVVMGRLEEEVWTVDTKVVKVDSRIQIGDDKVIIHYSTLGRFNPLSHKTRAQFTYQPY